jgi:predicted dehydrogenase
MSDPNSNLPASRRGFIRTAAGAAAASQVLFPHVNLMAQDNKKLKIGLVGMGGRGSGAARQACLADDNCELHAVADLYPQIVENQLRNISGALGDKAATKINVGDRKFVGIDAYQKVIESGVDVILLCTPPGFRPMQFEAAVNAGLHCFVEKPVATDVAGVKRVIEASRKAKEKGLSVLAGFCYRYNDHARDLFGRVLDGAIGDIKSIHATYWTNVVKPMQPESARPAGMSDTEWQVKNWYNYSWLGGDGIVEQAIHSVDKVFWAMRDQMPVAIYGMGGRQRPNHVCNTYDHFHITYEFPGGVRCHVDWNQYFSGPYKENADYLIGTDGEAQFDLKTAQITGKNPWKFRPRRDEEERNMYQTEHDEFFANIRKQQRHADEDWMVRSTMFGLAGRMAAYTGQKLTYDEVMNSGESLVPDKIDWNGSLPVHPMPIPGEVVYPPGGMKTAKPA